ncbi:hypothetical protein [Sphingomonas bacterium]|uniref:hypothetical protein n=1 Tax=Sphingomonas bacterium TaxID=1895847 RepID=UPI00260CF67B|nr:hypothetical protein [Sphingomonas bacterium]MDB5679034.1 hypothetical protein [Sphingomonas bacterium]
MFNSTLVQTKQELHDNTIGFAAEIANLAGKKTNEHDAVANGCSHAVEWVAFPDGRGGWVVAFSKYVGYRDVTPRIYDQFRKTHMTGTDTKRRVEKFGGTQYGVGRRAGLNDKHPAVTEVRTVCATMGKTPKQTAKVRVFALEERPAAMDILVAAIRAAALNDAELDTMIAEVKKAA